MRPLVAALAGLAAAVAGAVVLGDYPLSGSVPWVAAGLIPLLIGVVSTAVAGRHRAAFWVATGPVGAAAVAWGVRIATGWGLDPVPATAWAAMAIALVWPPAFGLLGSSRRTRGVSRPPVAVTPETGSASVNGELGHLGPVGRPEVGDP